MWRKTGAKYGLERQPKQVFNGGNVATLEIEAGEDRAKRQHTGHVLTHEDRLRGAAASKFRMRKSYRDSARLQEVMLAIAQNDELKAGERAKAAHVWVALADAQRIIAGWGLPKSVPASNDPASTPRKRKPGAATASAGLSDGPADGAA